MIKKRPCRLLKENDVNKRLSKYGFELLEPYHGGHYKHKIKCFCGNIFSPVLDSIFGKGTTSCGCLAKEKYDISNKRFGKLTVIKKIGISKNRQSIWLCLCDCGNTFNTLRQTIVSGNVKSCGCIGQFEGYEEISKTYWTRVVKRARRKHLDFNITPEYIWELFLKQERKCVLSGIELRFTRIII